MAEREPPSRLLPPDEFVRQLADFRGISLEEAEKQCREDALIENTEFSMVTGMAPDEVYEGFQPMSVTRLPAPVVPPKPEFVPSMLSRVWESMFKRAKVNHTIIAENGQMRTTPRLATPEEEEQFLIDETERRMTEPDVSGMPRRMAAAAGVPEEMLFGRKK